MATIESLLNKGLYLSVVDAQFQPLDPSGPQIEVALDELNGIFSDFKDYIPYSSQVKISTIADLENTNFSEIESVFYILSGIRYQVESLSRVQLSQQSSVIDLDGPVIFYHFDKLTQSFDIYPSPVMSAADYFEISGTVSMGEVVKTDLIPIGMPRFMQTFFKYELASRLCDFYSAPWSQKKEQSRAAAYSRLVDYMEVDLTPDVFNNYDAPSAGEYGWPLFKKISTGGA
tara:strand:- start:9410 stop:10099 length:690 start_codon:yes stop_codon:yes gene_type:complete